MNHVSPPMRTAIFISAVVIAAICFVFLVLSFISLFDIDDTAAALLRLICYGQ